jgi:hypothetical protein
LVSHDITPDEIETDDATDLIEEVTKGEIAERPAETGDPAQVLRAEIFEGIREDRWFLSIRSRFAPRWLLPLIPRVSQQVPLRKACSRIRNIQKNCRHIRWYDCRATQVRLHR